MEWVRLVWKQTDGIELEVVRKVLRAAVDVLVRELLAGRTISIRSLGSFFTYDRPERRFYNPAAGAFVDKPVTRLPRFKYSNWLKNQVMGRRVKTKAKGTVSPDA
jgi:nucleoid DNA-binding protein